MTPLLGRLATVFFLIVVAAPLQPIQAAEAEDVHGISHVEQQERSLLAIIARRNNAVCQVTRRNVCIMTDAVPIERLELLADEAQTAIRDIRNFLGLSVSGVVPIFIHYETGALYPVTLYVANSGGAAGLAERSFVVIPARLLDESDRNVSLAHELTHAIAPYPAGGDGNRNRWLLEEGIAVYMHNRFADAREVFSAASFSLHRAAQTRLRENRRAGNAPIRLQGGGSAFEAHSHRASRALDTQYILAGSFVKFLVETWGVERFKDIYRTGSFRSIYGSPLRELERKWKNHLWETFKN